MENNLSTITLNDIRAAIILIVKLRKSTHTDDNVAWSKLYNAQRHLENRFRLEMES